MATKVPVIMLQPMGGMGINYTTGDEVLVPQEVADAWKDAGIAEPKKGGKAGPDSKEHPDAVAPVSNDPPAMKVDPTPEEVAEAAAKAEEEAKAKADAEAAGGGAA
jgi:hypothetical protein